MAHWGRMQLELLEWLAAAVKVVALQLPGCARHRHVVEALRQSANQVTGKGPGHAQPCSGVKLVWFQWRSVTGVLCRQQPQQWCTWMVRPQDSVCFESKLRSFQRMKTMSSAAIAADAAAIASSLLVPSSG
jgi:hypothetical protein